MTEFAAGAIPAAAHAILIAQNASEGDAEEWEAIRLATAALEAAAPHITDARWTALRDYLSENIAADEAVRQGMVADGEDALAAPFGGLVSANRSTLRKMRELEAGQ